MSIQRYASGPEWHAWSSGLSISGSEDHRRVPRMSTDASRWSLGYGVSIVARRAGGFAWGLAEAAVIRFRALRLRSSFQLFVHHRRRFVYLSQEITASLIVLKNQGGLTTTPISNVLFVSSIKR